MKKWVWVQVRDRTMLPCFKHDSLVDRSSFSSQSSSKMKILRQLVINIVY